MGWRLIRIYTILVYMFMFLPIAVVVLLSFNANQFGSFPMTGLSTRWFEVLWENDAIMRAFRTSIVLGLMTAVISTVLGVLASLALVRYKVPGRNLITTMLIAPILVPEVVLAVALLAVPEFSRHRQELHASAGSGMSSSHCPSSSWWCRPAWSASSATWRRRR
jgi:spermidine/putrescine transport system permease protein